MKNKYAYLDPKNSPNWETFPHPEIEKKLEKSPSSARLIVDPSWNRNQTAEQTIWVIVRQNKEYNCFSIPQQKWKQVYINGNCIENIEIL